MALSTFDELKTSIANWIQVDDLTSTIPDFIVLAEALFNRRLRVIEMETRATLTTVGGDARYQLPAGHLETRRLQITTDNPQLLQYITPQDLVERKANVATGLPTMFTIEDEEFVLIPTPASDYELDQIFFKEVPALSDSNTTNWLLASHPDAYLYGSLVHAAPYIKDDNRVQLWEAGHERALRELEKADINKRLGGAPLRARSEVTRDTWKVRKGP